MKTFIAVMAIVAGILVTGCIPAHNSSPSTMNADREAVIEIMDRLLAALRAGDLDAFFTLNEDDALWMSPNSNVDLTKETVQKSVRRIFVAYDFRESELRIDEVIINGGWAIVRSRYSGIRLKDVSHLLFGSRHMQILRRQEDGSWRIARNIWNSPFADGA
jgi:uncharacterized protein (TIGR02246 family)